MSSPTTSQPEPSSQQLWLLVGTFAGSLVLVGVVMALMGAELTVPPTWMVLVVAAATLVGWATAALVPVSAGATGAGAVQSLTVLRLALLESPALFGLVLGFVTTPFNMLMYLLPALFALAGIWLLARPSVVQARIERAQTQV